MLLCVLALSVGGGFGQTRPAAKMNPAGLVDFELMTWPEVKQAMAAGKTTALIYNGGTEQRGPQNVNGGHTLMGHATVVAIAEKLGERDCGSGDAVFGEPGESGTAGDHRFDGSAVRRA